MLGILHTGLVLSMIVNIITALFSRKAGLKILPWLIFYFTILLLYDVLTNDVVWREVMKIAQKYPSLISYSIVILASAVLGAGYWKAVNKAVDKIDVLTTPTEQLSRATKNHYEIIYSQLPESQKDALEKLLVTDNPNLVSDNEWQPLEHAGFVERNFTGKKGIKKELKPLVDRLTKKRKKG
jgi:hypothetical protein